MKRTNRRIRKPSARITRKRYPEALNTRDKNNIPHFWQK